MSSEVIGIDLGTTYSCVAVQHANNVVAIANSYGQFTTPSWVYYSDSEVIVGKNARKYAMTKPGNVLFDMKRIIGRRFDDPVITRMRSEPIKWPFRIVNVNGAPHIEIVRSGQTVTVSPEEVCSHIILSLKRAAQSLSGIDYTKAVITVPANFNNAQRQATIRAGELAGIQVERLINEPTAAALAFMNTITDSTVPVTIGVFDFGGGTLDVSFMRMVNGRCSVLSTGGDGNLGGRDYDEAIVEHFLREIQTETGRDHRGSRSTMSSLWENSEQLKKSLTHQTEAEETIRLNLDGVQSDFNALLLQATFERIVSTLNNRCLVPLQTAFDEAARLHRVTRESVAYIVMVGGSSHIPKVRELVQAFFQADQRRVLSGVNPDHAIAIGAALQGVDLSRSHESTGLSTFDDVCPSNLGLQLHSGAMTILIPRNTRIPCSHSKVFATSLDGQIEASVSIYEGIGSETENFLGSFLIEGIPSAPARAVQFDVTFSYNLNGILEITAVARHHNISARLNINRV